MVDRVAELVVMILRNVIGSGGAAPPAEPAASPLDNAADAPNVASPLSERAHIVENNAVHADTTDLTAAATVWGGAS